MQPSGTSAEPADDDGKRDVTLEEAIRMAIGFQQRGQLEQADQVWSVVLEALPDHPKALHFSGVLAHQQGHADVALERIQRSLELESTHADWYSNLGIVLKTLGRADDAAAAFRQAIALDAGHANAHTNLGVILRAQQRNAEAEAEYRTALRLAPDHTSAYHNLGVLLQTTGRFQEAVQCFCKVMTLSPRHPEARRLLALAHCTLGETDKAVAIYEEWLAEEPGNPVAQHMLAACTLHDVPARASDAFVEKIFDDFADSFDSKLSALQYRAPVLVEAVLKDSGVPARQDLDVLDAGCGTGWCGPLIAPWARRLVGVDLSSKMLAQAREKEGVAGRPAYDELCHAELTGYLEAHPGAFDLIVSADTLVYFGDLEAVSCAASAALRPGGQLIFTLEDAGASPEPFHIDPHGRYAHRRDYVEAHLAAGGLTSEIVHAELRMEAGVAVKGLVVRAIKPSSGGVNHG